MATPQKFARDWVYNVISPFLTQLKNRLANIGISYNKLDNYIRFTNAENVITDIDLYDGEHNGVNVIYPRFAHYSNQDPNKKGKLVIMYPFDDVFHTMLTMELVCYIYIGQRSFTLELSGYNYQANLSWYGTSARQKAALNAAYDKIRFCRFLRSGGDPNNDADYTRFGFIIGDNDDTRWSYAKVAITRILAGYSNYEESQLWDSDNWFMDVMLTADIPDHKIDITRTV